MSYKILFFADFMLEHTKLLQPVLENHFQCIASSNTDEFRQVYLQSGKFAVLFSNAQKALNFRNTPDPNLEGVEFAVYVYLGTNQSFKILSAKILEDNRISVFKLSEKAGLISAIEKYLTQKDMMLESDLEFYKPQDNEAGEDDGTAS